MGFKILRKKKDFKTLTVADVGDAEDCADYIVQ